MTYLEKNLESNSAHNHNKHIKKILKNKANQYYVISIQLKLQNMYERA